MTLGRSAAELLAGVPILAGLERRALDRLAAGSHERHLRAGEALFEQGDAADSLAVVVAGRVEVVANGGGPERRVRVVGPGGAVGELSLLTGSPRAASVRALRDARLLVLDRDRFEEAMLAEPALARTLATVLAAELQREVAYLHSDAAGPTLRPDVVVVVALDPTAPVEEVIARIGPALGPGVRVAVLRDEPGRRPDLERLDRAEDGHDLVVLVVDDPPGGSEWLLFALRSADRVVAVSRGSRLASWTPDHRRRLHGCDLAVVGPVPASTINAFDAAFAPRARHLVPDGAGFAAAVDRALRRATGRALGVVLSGGGARGLAHLGVLDELVRAGVTIDRLGGCSMGAFIAALSGSGVTPPAALATARRELVDRHPFTDWTVPRASLIRGRRGAEMLERVFGAATLEGLPVPVFTVSADLFTGDLVVHRRGRVVEAVGASISIPGFAPPLVSDERLLVDGGLLDNLPVDVMVADGEGPVVAVDVMRRLGTPTLVQERSGPRLGRRAEARSERDGLPSIVDTIARSMTLGATGRVEANRALADVLISPEVAAIGLLDFDAVDAAVAAGRAAGRAALPEIGRLLPRPRP